MKMKARLLTIGVALLFVSSAWAQTKKPNILII